MKRWKYGYFFGVLLLLFVVGAVTIFSKQKHFSENENRVLAKLPSFAIGDFISGTYQEQLETAVNDQVILRDSFTKIATNVLHMLGRKDIGGVYLGKKETYLTKTLDQDIDTFQYMENLRYVEYLSGLYPGKVSLMLVPSAGTILKDRLPDYAPFYDAKSLEEASHTVCETTKVIDLSKRLCDQQKLLETQKENETVYFRTDHHWSLPGAYEGYAAFVESAGGTVKSYDAFAPEAVSKNFYGTLDSKVLGNQIKPDTIYAASVDTTQVGVVCDGENRNSIYAKEALQTKDQYAFFFGGNYAKVSISTAAQTGKRLVVIKDSFANSLVPFLLSEYDEITMIDLRFYRTAISELLQEYGDSQILILYELSNFANDKNIFKLSK